MDDFTSPVYQIDSDLAFYRHVLRTRSIFGLEMLKITPDTNIAPKIVVAKAYYHKSQISEKLDQPFKQYALRYVDTTAHPEKPIPGKQEIKFVNINARRVGCLNRLYNKERIPTVLIIRNEVILAEEFVNSELKLEWFMNHYMDRILQIPENAPNFPNAAYSYDYSHIEQLSLTTRPNVRLYSAVCSGYNSVLHRIGTYIPPVEEFPAGEVGDTAKMLCQIVDFIFYANNNTLDSSRFEDCEPVPIRLRQIRNRKMRRHGGSFKEPITNA